MKRTRNISFEEYGIDNDMASWLILLCQRKDMAPLVKKATELANCDLAPYLYKSLTEGVSYIQMEKSNDPVPATDKDFYGYRRKALALLSTLYVKHLMFGESTDW